MAAAVRILCDVVDKHDITSLLNFVVTDGACRVAMRYSRNVAGKINSCSLYYAAGFHVIRVITITCYSHVIDSLIILIKKLIFNNT